MPCVRETPQTGQVLTSFGTTNNFVPFTQWMPAVGLGLVDFLMEVRNVTGNWQAKAAYQFATVRTDDPDAGSTISSGSTVSSAGVHHFQEDFSLSTDKAFVRFGVAFSNSSGATLGRAEVSLTTAMKSCGDLLGANTVAVNPGLATSQTSYFPVTGWYPTVGLDQAMAAVVVADNAVANSLGYRLACRTANDRNAPNSWFDLESSFTTAPVGNSSRNTGLVGFGTPSPAMNAVQWVQFGLAINPQTTDCRATLHAAVGVTHT